MWKFQDVNSSRTGEENQIVVEGLPEHREGAVIPTNNRPVNKIVKPLLGQAGDPQEKADTSRKITDVSHLGGNGKGWEPSKRQPKVRKQRYRSEECAGKNKKT